MLEKEIRIGTRTLKNALVMAPTDLELSDHGAVTQKLLDYYESRASGNSAGLVVVEHSFVQEDGRAAYNQLSVARDEDVEGLKKLADLLHRDGTTAIAQLSHAGMAIPVDAVRTEGISPSGSTASGGMQGTHAASPEELDRLVESFALAAERVKQAGFDGMEIHSAHGYLLSQFYSPLTNHRQDTYTGSTLEGRLRLHVRILRAIRESIGGDQILGIRFGACDYREGGSTLSEAGSAAEILQDTGIDFIGVSGGVTGATRADNRRPGFFGDASEIIRNHVNIPVILTGGIRTREDAEQLLREGKADLIGAARPFIRNARWGEKILSAKWEGR